ncbi:hypothetical protein B7494_g4222 [Chlorociboria aeruginascens]|nr:hypothetical protein B7494_g4222 [Chlorociboria aeruginascens]
MLKSVGNLREGAQLATANSRTNSWLIKFKDGVANKHLENVDSEWEEFYEANISIIPHLLGTPAALRRVMTEMKARARDMLPVIKEGLTIDDESITTIEGLVLQVRIYSPTTVSGPFPALIYMHGGGWALGDLDADDTGCRSISVTTGVKVFSVGYRLAPENPYPAAVDDCWAALNWILENSDSLNIDKSRIILGGSSAGANLAAVLTYRARKNHIEIRGQLLRMPTVCHMDCYPSEFKIESMEENKNAPILSKRSMELFYSFYDPSHPADINISPLLADDFGILPPTHLQICGKDPLRDEGLAYAEKLDKAGVKCTVDVYHGLPHAFTFFPELSATKKYARDTLRAIASFLED